MTSGKRACVWLALILPGVFFVTIFMLIPLFSILVSTFFSDSIFTLENYGKLLRSTYFQQVFGRSVRLSLLSTLLCALLGFPCAYYISRYSKRKGLMMALAVFPMFTSPVIRSFSWMVILGRKGIVNQMLVSLGLFSRPQALLYNEFSMTVGFVQLFLPQMILSLLGVMDSIPGDLTEAAGSLGATRFTAFMRIVFPLSVSGLVTGAVLVFTGCMTAYTTPQLLGATDTQVLSTMVYQYAMSLRDWVQASAVAMVMIVVTMLVFIVLLAFAVSFMVKVLLSHFYEILGSIRSIQKGDMTVRIAHTTGDEMGELGHQINKMMDRIQNLMEENIRRELLAKNSEIRSLQNQINAHFIYNVLESIKMMAEMEEQYEISDAITSLGKLLRYSMKWRSGNVLLKEELEYIRNYLALINLRFDYEIYLSENIPEELMNQRIPKMSLQPIVENAIYHGIEQIAEDTTIYIKGILQDKTCCLEISDMGRGMSEEKLAELQEKLQMKDSYGEDSEHGIGLKNVQDRIHMAFGDAYGLSVSSKEGLYTKVSLTLPLETAANSNG